MISIENSPPEIVLSGNPVRFNVSTTNALSTLGEYASFRLQITGFDPISQHQFKISFGIKVLIFTLGNRTPEDDPLIVPIGIDIDSWGADLCENFQQNNDLNHAYNISFHNDAGVYIMFVARQKGSFYSITFDTMTTTGLAELSNVAGVDEAYRNGFAILMNLWSENTALLLAEDLKNVDSTGHVTFNISEYLQSILFTNPGTRFAFPETGPFTLITRSSYVLPYFVSFAEKYDGSYRKAVFDELRYALPGGVSREMLVYLNSENSDFFSHSSTKNRFLTFSPRVKTVSKTCLEKLFFCIINPYDHPFYAHCKVNFTDGTNETFESAHVNFSETLTVVEISVGYHFLGLGSLKPLKTVFSWEICMKNSSDVIVSETKVYELDPSFFEIYRQFIFRNSLSGYDTIKLTGIAENNNEYERQSAFEFLDAEETFFNYPEKLFNCEETVTFKASTGWLSFAEKDWLRDLLLSKEVYEISGKRLLPVLINSKKAFISKDKEDLYSLEFDYTAASPNSFYSSSVGLRTLTADNNEITADNDLITSDQLTY